MFEIIGQIGTDIVGLAGSKANHKECFLRLCFWSKGLRTSSTSAQGLEKEDVSGQEGGDQRGHEPQGTPATKPAEWNGDSLEPREAPGSWHLGSGQEKAFQLYKACMDAGATEAAGAGPLGQGTEEIDQPEFDIPLRQEQEQQIYAQQTLFDLMWLVRIKWYLNRDLKDVQEKLWRDCYLGKEKGNPKNRDSDASDATWMHNISSQLLVD
ncbi:Kell blood group glycoprotein [Manis javanica]|nr:Kell blood group glycoprotein [Manis javanica]